MKTQSETLVMVVCLSKVSLVPRNVSLLLRSLQHQNCIAAIPLICKKMLLLTGKGTTRRSCSSPTSRRGKLVLIYNLSDNSSLPFFHSQFQAKFVPLSKTTLSAQEQNKSRARHDFAMDSLGRESQAEIKKIINGR